MKTIKIIKRNASVHISQPKDRFGCTGFISYGVLILNHYVLQIRNPDFNWKISQSDAAQLIAFDQKQNA